MADDNHYLSLRPSVALTPYNGIPLSDIQPVFQTACKLRHSNPQTGQIIAATKTTLEARVVSAIIEAARRLVSPSKDPAGEAMRKQTQRDRTERALHAEEEFVNKVRVFQNQIMDERQQRQTILDATRDGKNNTRRITPDILFLIPTVINGVLCHWIEYKDTFGFKADPYVHGRNRKQYRKYATMFGSGMVVYKLGHQTELLYIEGVACFREAEIIDWISRQLISAPNSCNPTTCTYVERNYTESG